MVAKARSWVGKESNQQVEEKVMHSCSPATTITPEFSTCQFSIFQVPLFREIIEAVQRQHLLRSAGDRFLIISFNYLIAAASYRAACLLIVVGAARLEFICRPLFCSLPALVAVTSPNQPPLLTIPLRRQTCNLDVGTKGEAVNRTRVPAVD